MNIGIQPTMSYNQKTNLQNRPSSKFNSPLITQQGKHISFGDGSSPKTYDYKSALKDLKNDKSIVEGDTPEDAFGKFYKSITNKLITVAERERIKAQNWKIPDHVEKEIPIAEKQYVKAMSGFVRQYGSQPKLADADSAVVNHITNSVGIPKPNWLENLLPNDFKRLKGIMKTSYEFLKDGLIIIKNAK